MGMLNVIYMKLRAFIEFIERTDEEFLAGRWTTDHHRGKAAARFRVRGRQKGVTTVPLGTILLIILVLVLIGALPHGAIAARGATVRREL